MPLGFGVSSVVVSAAGALLLVGAQTQSTRAATLADETGNDCSLSHPRSPNLCQQRSTATQEAGVLTGTGIAALGVGVLLAGAAVTVVLWPRDDTAKPPTTGVTLVPVASITSAGLGVHGRF